MEQTKQPLIWTISDSYRKSVEAEDVFVHRRTGGRPPVDLIKLSERIECILGEHSSRRNNETTERAVICYVLLYYMRSDDLAQVSENSSFFRVLHKAPQVQKFFLRNHRHLPRLLQGVQIAEHNLLRDEMAIGKSDRAVTKTCPLKMKLHIVQQSTRKHPAGARTVGSS